MPLADGSLYGSKLVISAFPLDLAAPVGSHSRSHPGSISVDEDSRSICYCVSMFVNVLEFRLGDGV